MEKKSWYIVILDGYEDTYVFGFFQSIEDAKAMLKEKRCDKFVYQIYELKDYKNLA